MNSEQLQNYFQARINLQLALFFKAIKEDNEQEKEKIKVVINELKEICKALDIQVNTTIRDSFDLDIKI
tara:strand:- start:64057 stop:64263 length:207 start_codon:yes stop_codon:yes gene_type:complete